MNDLDSPLRFPAFGLYVITRGQDRGAELESAVRGALLGGAVAVQYRQKSAHDAEDEARRLRAVCRAFGAPLIINDDIELAARTCADGVHLGREDRPIAEARERLRPGSIIGASCYDSVDLADEAVRQGADYVAFGRFFASSTKPLASPAHLETLTAARSRLTVPIVAIGGIRPENAASLLAAGAGVTAVVDAVFGQDDPEEAARAFRNLFASSRL